MKKILIMLAAAMIGFGAVSCKEDPILPPVVAEGCEVCGQDPCVCESENEITLTVPVELMIGGVGYTEASMPGDKILEFFDMTAEEFYAAMGTWSGSGADGTTVQENNTIQFGLANKNDHMDLKFVPSTANNIGHWVNSEAGLTWWNGQEAQGNFYAYAESYVEWGLETPDAETLEYMWTYSVGSWAEDVNPGDKFKFTEVFYQIVEGETEDIEKLCYVEWEIEFTEFKAREITALETVTSEMTFEYNNTYAPIPVTGFDYAAIAAKLGVTDPFTECEIYPVAADGTFASLPSADNWFGADGNVSGWGDNAIFDFKYDTAVAKDNFTLFCMPYNPAATDAEGNPAPQTIEDKLGTFTASVAFVNEADKAVVLKLTVTIEAPKPWDGEIAKTYDLAVSFAHNNDWYGATLELDAEEIATTLGVASVAEAKMLGADKFAGTDLYYANEAGVDILNIYLYEGEFIAAPIAAGEGVDVATLCGTTTGTFYLVNEDKGVQINVNATITAPAAE